MEEKNNQKTDPNEGSFESIKARPVTLKDNYNFFNRNILFLILSFIVIMIFKIFIHWFYAPIFMGFKIKGKKNLKFLRKKGYVLVSNHIHPLDSFLIGTTLLPKKTYVLMRESNLGVPFFGWVMRTAGGVPIPTRRDLFTTLLKSIPNQINNNRVIVMMPETALILYHNGIRPFAKGAFRIAVNASSNLLPVVWTYRKRKGFRKLFGKRPLIQLNILAPIMIEPKGSNHQTIEFYENYTHDIMSAFFDKTSRYP